MRRCARSMRSCARRRSRNSARCEASRRRSCSRSVSKAFRRVRATSRASRCGFRACCDGARISRSTTPIRSPCSRAFSTGRRNAVRRTLRSNGAASAPGAENARGAGKADAVAELFRPVPMSSIRTPRRPSSAPGTLVRAKGWQPFPFQREVWKEIARGRERLAARDHGRRQDVGGLARRAGGVRDKRRTRTRALPAPLTVLWITPMRALAADTARALQTAVDRTRGAVERRLAHRRHPVRRTRAPEQAHAVRARHHARKPHADAHARRRAGGDVARAAGRRR